MTSLTRLFDHLLNGLTVPLSRNIFNHRRVRDWKVQSNKCVMFELTLICPCRNHVNANWPVNRDTPNSWDNCILFIELAQLSENNQYSSPSMLKVRLASHFLLFISSGLYLTRQDQAGRRTPLKLGFSWRGTTPPRHMHPFPIFKRKMQAWRSGAFPKFIWKIQSKSKQNLNPRQEREKYRFPFFFGLQQTLHFTSILGGYQWI